jgi:hypothetical protein
MPDVTFWLVKILKPEMRAKFKRAQRHAKLNCSLADPGDRDPLGKAKVGNCDLYSLKDRRGFRGCELVIGKQFQASLIEFDPVLLNLFQKLKPAHAADANGSGHKWVVTAG